MTEVNETYGCILSKFYIKPQLRRVDFRGVRSCILSKFYIKPQRKVIHGQRRQGCILSKFYIKPQHIGVECCHLFVVSYRNSTSNHNMRATWSCAARLYLIEILHQTTTNQWRRCNTGSCILSKFYIKPQQQLTSTQRSTSCILSKFYIKPQLAFDFNLFSSRCILSKFYIKPQHCVQRSVRSSSCILSKFYIKPQQLFV